MLTKVDERWAWFGITAEFLEAKAEWLRAPRTLHGNSVCFFELSGTLVSYSRFDYPLSSLAFFQAAIGLERALKLYYRAEEKNLGVLLARAVKDSVVHDSLFSVIPPLSDRFLSQLQTRPPTHSQMLAHLVPELRNQFFHGTYLLAPEYLHLTFHLREAADALVPKNG